jgi:tetratricopeptide (TPR) repeat protein
MKRKTRVALVKLMVILIGGFLLILSQQFLSRFQKDPLRKERDIYLPEAGYLRFISLGHDGLVSDLVLARALTYFGSHYHERNHFGFKHLEKLFTTAVEMDPLNREAFLMAGNILSDIQIQSAIAILKLGMMYHPDYWKFPEMIGFRYFFNLNNPHQAAKYYEIASRCPGHPPYVPSLSGKFYQESGRYEEALRVLYNFYSTTRDKRLKESFKASINALREKIAKQDFQLHATVLNVLDGETVEFRPDPDNPQFKGLKSLEQLKIAGINAFPSDSVNPQEKLMACWQQEYVRYFLDRAQVRIEFEREENGRLKRDKKNRLLGTITLKNGNRFKPLPLHPFPPAAADLNRKEVYRYVGKLVSLRFTVHEVIIDAKGREIELNEASHHRNTFSAIIPFNLRDRFTRGNEDAFSFFKGLAGKRITVTGFAGVKGRQVQVKISFPSQLEEL